MKLKTVDLHSFVAFTGNELDGTHLTSQNQRFQGFTSKLLRVIRLMGEKVRFFLQLPWYNWSLQIF